MFYSNREQVHSSVELVSKDTNRGKVDVGKDSALLNEVAKPCFTTK